MIISDMETPEKFQFEDADFPATSTSLFSSYSTPIAKFSGEISWLRPQVWIYFKGASGMLSEAHVVVGGYIAYI